MEDESRVAASHDVALTSMAPFTTAAVSASCPPHSPP
jgi:hypothetical protein